MVNYRILHNLDARYRRPYEPGDRLVDGYTGVLDLDTTAAVTYLADVVFLRHNHDNRPDGADAPSLSVGDVIVFDTITLSVAPVGFATVTIDPADRLHQSWRVAVRGA